MAVMQACKVILAWCLIRTSSTGVETSVRRMREFSLFELSCAYAINAI